MSSSSSSTAGDSFSGFLSNISSYDSNVLLAAVISLLLVILFVVLLHLYAKCIWSSAQPTRPPQPSLSISVISNSTIFNFEDHSISPSKYKGLDSAAISSIPLFVYNKSDDDDSEIGLECVICLSPFEENDVGKQLPNCGHVFHVVCIDVWLQSHSNCPICRAPLALTQTTGEGEQLEAAVDMIIIDEESGGVDQDSIPVSSSPSSSSITTLSCSLKRMLSRNNRSSEHKVFPTSSSNA